jgi:L-fucose mutarotase/ribose pyranase (RbsD/FucU family)
MMVKFKNQLYYLKRFEFYKLAKSSDVCLTIATGEVRRFANLLLKIDVIKKELTEVSVTEKINEQWMH